MAYFLAVKFNKVNCNFKILIIFLYQYDMGPMCLKIYKIFCHF